ncbi:hypothetical protein [Paraburkholderia sp. C35]|uniref:hypothetical protein n=1 Tax=Paraburkholderia sp. C35 TaxID=2126993 RepID=UPI001EF6A440|nr:hypothetical protein [Paraburkholderia sp. C35]
MTSNAQHLTQSATALAHHRTHVGQAQATLRHNRVDDGDIEEWVIDGRTYRVRINVQDDIDHGAPWEEHDGHGPVSDWTTRDKRPGERVLSSDRGIKRFYDVQEANRIAEQDGWGLTEEHKAALLQRLAKPRVVRRPVGKATVTHRYGGLMQEFHRSTETVTIPGRDPNKPLTSGEIRAEAVRRDFENLRGWANDQWHYVGVIVTLLGEDEDQDDQVATDYGHALWGIEDTDPAYIRTTADELIDDVVREAHNEYLEAQHWAARDVTTH